MGKALVLKNVNFATNKLDTITYGDIVPCTGIALSQNTITFTGLGATVQLNAALTPANTTDELLWTSSDADVATVSDGLVTCVGVGSATITATCGTQTATCSVTATVVIALETAYHAENGANYSGSMDLNANPPKNHIGRNTNSRGRLFYSTEPYGTYRAFSNAQFDGQYLIPMPKGAIQATMIFPTGLEKRHVAFILGNSDEKQTYVTGTDGNSALGVKNYQYNNNTDAQIVIDISDYAPYANGFIASWTFVSGSTTDPATITGTTTIIFS